MAPRRAALIILDGWGQREALAHNAVRQAHTPHLTALRASCPATTLGASGMAVGLPEGQMGNSEVGHLNLGSGRIVYQDFTRINQAIADGSFARCEALLAACAAARDGGGALHLLGLLSDGGVHSHQEHLYALLRLAREQGVARVFVHPFLDGRDTPPRSGSGYLAALEAAAGEIGVGRVASVCGRFYAMDRDHRWDRVARAYGALVGREGRRAGSARQAVEAAYAAGQSDEFVEPWLIADADGGPLGPVRDGDAVVFFNFRADRAREITRAFTDPGFEAFETGSRPRLATFVAFTEYDETFHLPIAFPAQRLHNLLGQVVANAGLRQLRIAETEKYAHVTFFFNGGQEEPFPGEQRVLIPSPREVATYDLQPEMSAFAVRDRLIQEIGTGQPDLIVANFANLDMVGHTGVMDAAVRAVEAVDQCVGAVVGALRGHGYAVLITADHGNAEEMFATHNGQAHTAHTLNRVPLLLVDDQVAGVRLRDDGILADVAPTLLQLMGLAAPAEMTGASLRVG
ncbi:MAG TPA: 2,3-bisphosphoglycerate-independent phosphoglycerate mutase [Deferrisomatales bacterium]|nr:2,3-bisphosphoglycerate-independent phosphoglycerate mutase [Deferrisomatales bacterium]